MGARSVIFLTDFGHSDEFAGVCRAVIERYAPGTRVVDLTHGIPAGDIRRGALALAAAVPYAPADSVWLAVVDPGVGTERRAVALRAGDGHLIGPDNGLLTLAAEVLGGVEEAVEISGTPVRLEPTSSTFHGRDIFAPVAAALARGGYLSGLGESLGPQALQELELPSALAEPGRLTAHVLCADGYGNLVLDAGAKELEAASLADAPQLAVRTEAGHSQRVTRGRTFADGQGALVLYDDSVGRLGLALAGESAASALALGRDDRLTIEAWQ